MPSPRFTFWCPRGCGKRVVGLNVAKLHNAYVEDGKRFICYNCEENFDLDELKQYGNNISRVVRQQKVNKHDFSPKMPVGMNQW